MPRGCRSRSCSRQARRFRDEGADVIDLGCDPGSRWDGLKEAVAALREEGFRVSIDSFDPAEVADAVGGRGRAGPQRRRQQSRAGRRLGRRRSSRSPTVPGTLEGLDETIAFLGSRGVPFRIDPIIEPIGFGFAASLGRYLEIRRRYPEAEIMMGVGQPDRADRRRLGRGQHDPDRLLRGAGHPERADDRRDQLGAVVGPRDRPRPPAGPSRRLPPHAAQARRAPPGDAPRPPRSPSSARPISPSSSGGSATRTGGSSPRAG